MKRAIEGDPRGLQSEKNSRRVGTQGQVHASAALRKDRLPAVIAPATGETLPEEITLAVER